MDGFDRLAGTGAVFFGFAGAFAPRGAAMTVNRRASV